MLSDKGKEMLYRESSLSLSDFNKLEKGSTVSESWCVNSVLNLVISSSTENNGIKSFRESKDISVH